MLRCISRPAVLALLLTIVGAGVAPAAEEAPLVPTRGRRPPVSFDRQYPNGAILLRYERGRYHFALALDQRPVKFEERRVTLEDGRTIDFHWSSRSLWIGGGKYELPFGDVFLVHTRDSIRVTPLEFQAVRGGLMLEQLAADSSAAAWLAAHTASNDAPVRQKAEGSTQPGSTTEIAAWSWRGLHALTCVLNGEASFALVCDRPVRLATSKASFGGFDATVEIGGPGEDEMTLRRGSVSFTFKDAADHPAPKPAELSSGRAFFVASAGSQQKSVGFDFGPGAVPAFFERVASLPEVARHLGREAGE